MDLSQGEATMATVREAVARGLRELREANGWRQDDVARAARLAGLTGWTAATVANVETQRRDVSVVELLALGVAVGRPVVELLALPDEGRLVHGAAWSGSDAVRWLLGDGRTGEQDPRLYGPDGLLSDGEPAGWSDSAVKAARRLGLEPAQLEVLALDVFGRPFDDERELRLAADADPTWTPRTRQARRGHITRQLLEELSNPVGGDGK